MTGDELQQCARERADELPLSSLEHPFGPEWDVFKVQGRVFMLMTAVTGEPIVTLKAAPADGEALRAQFSDISPGYHMNKKHWITLRAGGALPKDLVAELVTDSYLLVVAKLQRAPVPEHRARLTASA
ncbi:MmcQ/YjbR family DNA-binding protein [Microbacterium aurum]|uniref:Cytoplasmic protein n=1 Tax=Microbacterium aurum TaxID=36805 RepID=A0A1P8U5S8_9MICO|nr:MmcQ/YjbR family DNA-binding protein [Microbacterium aurum]APZ33462.1 cytoplasmic protein [Microbacterium aurum]MBM7827131.1 putative DNA-binding protein (MmcQ/YjbR family) [Microbacterium aurum]